MMKKFSIIKVFFLIGVILLSSCDNVAYQEEVVQETPATSARVKDFMAEVSLSEVGLGQSIIFTDNSIGVKSRTWYIPGSENQTSSAAEVITSWEKTGDANVDDLLLGPKKCTLTIVFRDGSIVTKDFNITVVGFGNKWTPQVLSFEDDVKALSEWKTWSNQFSAPWDPGVFTVVDGGANETAKTARIDYTNGGATSWYGMLSRDARLYNAKIEAGKTYELSFYVKADQPGSIHYVAVINNIESWMPALEGDVLQEKVIVKIIDAVPVTTEWEKRTYTVGPVDFSGKSGYDGGVGLNTYPEISFNGSTPNVFYIDEFKLTEIEN